MAVATASGPVLHLQDCTYTSCYCEENVYFLLKQLVEQHDRTGLFAVFISNANETVPFWYQRARQHPDGFVVWDYHVIAFEVREATPTGVLVWDLDLHHPTLPLPCTLQQYADHALQAGAVQLPPQFQRMLRLVPAASLLQHFASDRSHMRSPDGSWCAEPPPYPCITAADGSTMNLAQYRDMQADVLQDRITDKFEQHSIMQISSPSSAALAAIVSEIPNSVGSMAAVPTQHPCKPAAGVFQGETGQVLQPNSNCGVHTTQDHTNTSLGKATAYGSNPAASFGEEEGRQSSQEGSEGARGFPTRHSTAAARLDCASDTAACNAGFRLETWEDVVLAAHSSRFGVVVQEDTLLRCLLGEAS